MFVVRKKQRVKPCKTSFKCRSFKNYDKASFQNGLQEHNWDSFFLNVDPETAWLNLYDVILKFADKHCPSINFVAKKAKPIWIYQEVLEHLHERDRVHRLAKHSDSIQLWNDV